jgi:hypothetical protein
MLECPVCKSIYFVAISTLNRMGLIPETNQPDMVQCAHCRAILENQKNPTDDFATLTVVTKVR